MICKNPGGGTPPPNFTQGGVMDCHPPLETAYARTAVSVLCVKVLGRELLYHYRKLLSRLLLSLA